MELKDNKNDKQFQASEELIKNLDLPQLKNVNGDFSLDNVDLSILIKTRAALQQIGKELEQEIEQKIVNSNKQFQASEELIKNLDLPQLKDISDSVRIEDVGLLDETRTAIQQTIQEFVEKTKANQDTKSRNL